MDMLTQSNGDGVIEISKDSDKRTEIYLDNIVVDGKEIIAYKNPAVSLRVFLYNELFIFSFILSARLTTSEYWQAL